MKSQEQFLREQKGLTPGNVPQPVRSVQSFELPAPRGGLDELDMLAQAMDKLSNNPNRKDSNASSKSTS